MSITPAQCLAARATLGLERSALAALARMSPHLVANFETGEWTLIDSRLRALRAAFEAAGVEFISENGGGAGVRLRKP